MHMTPLTEKQTADYLRHRINAAGISDPNLFSMDQIRKIHQESGGLPGWINEKAVNILTRRKKQRLIPLMFRRKINLEPLKFSLRGHLPRLLKT